MFRRKSPPPSFPRIFVIEETAKTNPKATGQTPETLRLLEPSVLDEIKKSGFVDKVKN